MSSAVRLRLKRLGLAASRTLVALQLMACGGSASAAAPPTNAALENALRQNLADYLTARSSIEHISTLSLTVNFRGGSDINFAVGTTQYGVGAPVTPANVFQTGSNTKSFTAALILKLEAAGVLSINDTLGKWLPQYPAWSNVTIRQLLNMTSGIPTYDNTPAQTADYGNNPFSTQTPDKLIAYVYPTIKKPGTAWEYSNTGYALSQMIIDKVSASHSYTTELHNLIASVGLKNSFYEPYFYPPTVAQRLVSGYYVNTDPPVITKLLGKDTSTYSLDWAQAAGGMVSTPEDLAIWVRALFEGNVLAPKQLNELKSLVAIPSGKPIPQATPSTSGFGLGVFQITEPKMGLFWGYQGSTIGYRATYAYLPSSGLIICVFTNSQTAEKLNTVNTVLFPNLYATLKAAGKV